MIFADVSATILAGGQSRRMGYPKCLAKIGEVTLLDILIEKLTKIGFEKIWISINRDTKIPLKDEYNYIFDDYTKVGPLAGILAALENSKADYSFIIPCDVPFISEKIIIELLENRRDDRIVIAKDEKGIQPLIGVYPRNSLDSVRNIIASGKRRIISVFEIFPVETLDFSSSAGFLNINTPEDLIVANGTIDREL